MPSYRITPASSVYNPQSLIDVNSISPFKLSRDKSLLLALERAIAAQQNHEGIIYTSPSLRTTTPLSLGERGGCLQLTTAFAINFHSNSPLFSLKQLYSQHAVTLSDKGDTEEVIMAELTLENALYYAHHAYLRLYLKANREEVLTMSKQWSALKRTLSQLLIDDGFTIH